MRGDGAPDDGNTRNEGDLKVVPAGTQPDSGGPVVNSDTDRNARFPGLPPTDQDVTGLPPAGPGETRTAGIGTSADRLSFDSVTTAPFGSLPSTEHDYALGKSEALGPRIPGYRILGVLGRGGMGLVYSAHHLALDRRVALKVVLGGDHASDEQRVRFLTEARAVAQLLHPNIVQIYEIGETEGLPYFSLEYVDGGSLEQKVGRLPQEPRWSAALVESIARAMHVAHRGSIIHRDLKPANVLLTQDGTPKITDFGLAKRLETDSGQTRTGSIMGTPTYMAPEQAWGRTADVGRHSDLYSIGAILYTLLTGRPPFQGTSALETLEQVRTQEPVPPSRLQPKLPGDLETICLKCLEKEPAKRYETALDLADDLRRFLDGDSIIARPVSVRERVLRQARRNPKVAFLAALVLFLLVAVAVVSTTYAARLRQSSRKLLQTNEALVNASAKERAARLEAEASVKQAFEQNRSALDAWKTLGRLTIEDLRDVPGAQQVRQKFLDEVLQGLKKTAGGMEPLYQVYRRVENARVADFAMAGVHKLLGDELLELGQSQDAREHYKRMDTIAEEASAADPANLDLQYQLANSRSVLGKFLLLEIGDAKAAVNYSADALKLRRHRLAVEPDSDEAKLGVANSLGQLAICHQRLGEIDQAKVLYDEELPVRESLSTQAKVDFETMRELSGYYDQIGMLALQQGDVATARKHYDRCYSIRKSLALKKPEHVANLRDLNRSLCALGELCLVVQNDPSAARRYYEQALEAFRRIQKLEPTTTHNVDVARGCYYLATALLRLGETPKAQALYRECLEIRRSLPLAPDAKMQQVDLAVALARCGQHEEAARITRGVLDGPPLNSLLYIEVACARALCVGATSDPALKSRYAEETLAAIREGCKEGWKDYQRFRVDPDLDPIRGDPAFQRLLRELENPVKPAGS
jgi:serine/threonine-protein kinase